MIVGEYAGRKVSEVKPIIKDLMVKNGDALIYNEPESKVISRSGEGIPTTPVGKEYSDGSDLKSNPSDTCPSDNMCFCLWILWIPTDNEYPQVL